MGEKRLTITFPAGHPVWSYPRGRQSAKVREWVDTALGLAEILEGIRMELQALRNNGGLGVGSTGPSGEGTDHVDHFSEFVRAFER
ncbi:MAG: hypothetical protein M1130_05170 [Actinobacteria bacterium]|nr:hypothetical protein [Actinomycetota bacterium]